MWLDIPQGSVHVTDPTSSADRVYLVGAPVGAVVHHADGGFLLGTADGLVRWRPGSRVEPLCDLPLAGRRPNDAVVDPQGRLLIGLAGEGRDGSLVRVAPDAAPVVVIDGLRLPNGADFAPDGRSLWFTDSFDECVRRYPYPELGPPIASVAVDAGLPDGLAVDADGNLWVAQWSAGQVGCYTPDGRKIATVTLPVPLVTSCAFGGPDLSTLFITTMAEAPGHPRVPQAGDLFACPLPVAGQPPRPYGGG